MSGKGVVGAIIASVILSVGITGALAYFLLPVVFPNITEEPPTYEDQGIVLQSIYYETDSAAVIIDTDTTYEKVPDTEVNITIEQNSRIQATFSGDFRLAVDGSFKGGCNFFIVLKIEGIGNRTMRIHFYDNTGPYPTTTRVFSHNLNIGYQTEGLSAGTYTISVHWMSEYDATGYAQLNLAYPGSNRTRTLLVQEII